MIRDTAKALDEALAVANGPMFKGEAPYRTHVGYIQAPTPGRADKIEMTVPAQAYMIPADIVSGRGQGNSEAGAKFFDAWLMAPYNAQVGGQGKFASGGAVEVPHGVRKIMASGGEYVVPPQVVQQLGGGDIRAGHDLLDEFVKDERARLVHTLVNLPGPKQNG